ncbi:MAG TPA: septation protein SepH [Nocardioides sp.]|uniref:septation protein SepH n=1 Tax=Nocardioides sp. TaxID=35761 RepID=UPI002D7ECF3E|nr:septation protein SepH [Nocardioides sp.]HET6651584.1 septation protein SepH [Nocardioides sp.]
MDQQDLTLVGLTDDGTALVLVSDSGEEFRLAADAKLRAALRGDHARLGQLEITMESALRPRDIQARIRAGETPESVAAAASTSIDKIMGYATPVLAERAHIADRAQRASLRRKGGEGSTRLLGDAVAERLRSRNVDPATVDWDAWRREDGRWTLVADYRSGESTRHAEFVFDAPGRYVVAEDDEARWLVGEQSASKGPQPRTAAPAGRRLSAVPADDELPLGEDAIGLVSEPASSRHDEERTADLTTAGDADWIATQASDRPEPARPAPADDEPEAEQEEEPARKPSKKRGRASVPSWDEIMFGGGKGD